MVAVAVRPGALIFGGRRPSRCRILAAAGCAALAAVAAPVFAQPAPPITWVAYAQGKPGKTSDWVKLTVKYDAPIYDKLMAAGVVRSWGIATPINHRPGFGWNLLTWVTVDNWDGVEKWAGASMQAMQARSAEETKAIESELRGNRGGRTPATSTRWCATQCWCPASRAPRSAISWSSTTWHEPARRQRWFSCTRR